MNIDRVVVTEARGGAGALIDERFLPNRRAVSNRRFPPVGPSQATSTASELSQPDPRHSPFKRPIKDSNEESMTISPHFKPDTCALVLIDHQVGTIQLIRNITSDASVRNAVILGKAALAFDIPIVMTSSQEDHIQGPLHPSLQRALPNAYAKRVKRTGIVNAWDDPNFQKAVKDTGRPQLVMAAVTTDICLVFPAISAVEAGFEVQAVLDASGSSFDIGEETSRRRMERAGVWLTSTNTMVAELVHNWATPQGMKLVSLIAANPPMLPVD